MNPQLSIIIPCYNCDKTLREAVDSCYTQGFSTDDFEIVLVDDDSTDTTKALLASLVAEKANIRIFFHERNQGGGATRNTATEKARAPVIFCLDSDDLLPSGTLRTMYDFLQEKNADGVGIHHSTKFKGTDVTDVGWKDTFAYAGERIPLENLLQQGGANCSLYSVFMYTKAAFTACSGYPTHHGFDTQGFAWRFLAAGLTAYTVPNTYYLHRINFHQSYYLREYDSGKLNVNWQLVLLEHAHLFTPDTLAFIKNYPLANFTKSLYGDLCLRSAVFLPPSERRLGESVLGAPATPHTLVPRSSLKGVYYRIIARLRKLIKEDTHLKPILLKLYFLYQDLRSRLRSPQPGRLLIAYLKLTHQKLQRQQFIALPEATTTIVDIVIPTLGKDFELFDAYLTHLRTNITHRIGNTYVVAPGSDTRLRNYCLANHLTFIDERSLLGYGKEAISYQVVNGLNRASWLFQQLLKLSGDLFVEHDYYIIVDSDTLLLRPHNFLEHGKSVFFENTEWHPPYFSAFKRLFGYDAPHPLSLTSHMMIFEVNKIKAMKAEMEQRHHLTWDQAYITACDKTINSGISDYDTYAQWLLYHHPNEVLTKPFYNHSFSRRRFGELATLKEKYRNEALSFSFHSYNL